jgi:hypothetical protein
MARPVVHFALALSAVAACGNTSVTSAPPAPRLIAGGGLGDGPVAGALNVYVTDDATRAPVSGSTVRVGAPSDPAACTALTDSTGLAIFDAKSCALVASGKQSLTASAAGYAPSTWLGVDATNLTVTIRATTPPPVDSAVVTGTIAGWDTLPAPAAAHNTLAIVGYSADPTASDAVNNIAQDMRNVHVASLNVDVPVASNVCLRNALVDDCAWRFKTRLGAQAHYAVVVDQDTKGTDDDDSDDTFTVIAWAIKSGLSFEKDQGADGEALTLLTDDQMQPFTASFPAPPSALDYLAAFPILDLGGDGRIAIVLPALDLTHMMTRVPKLAGPFAGARYDLLAKAQDGKATPQPSTLSWSHGVDATKTVSSLPWLPPPTGLAATAGTYAFTAVPGATVQGVELQTPAGARAWSVTIFDGTTSFALPGVSPDPLPAGDALLVVSALVIPGFKVDDAAFDELAKTLTQSSSAELTFTH